MILPKGAQEVIDVRKRGMKPSEMLIISLVGKVNELNHTVYAAIGGVYDWRWCVGLNLCLFVEPGSFWRDLALSIAKENPEHLYVWDVYGFRGAECWAFPNISDIGLSKAQRRYKLDFLPWMKFQNEQFMELVCN